MTQRRFEKIALMILSSIFISIMCWVIINNLIVSVNFLEYFLIEYLLLFGFKLFTFVSKQIHAIEE
jgi:hypothetical protein